LGDDRGKRGAWRSLSGQRVWEEVVRRQGGRGRGRGRGGSGSGLGKGDSGERQGAVRRCDRRPTLCLRAARGQAQSRLGARQGRSSLASLRRCTSLIFTSYVRYFRRFPPPVRPPALSPRPRWLPGSKLCCCPPPWDCTINPSARARRSPPVATWSNLERSATPCSPFGIPLPPLPFRAASQGRAIIERWATCPSVHGHWDPRLNFCKPWFPMLPPRLPLVDKRYLSFDPCYITGTSVRRPIDLAACD